VKPNIVVFDVLKFSWLNGWMSNFDMVLMFLLKEKKTCRKKNNSVIGYSKLVAD
jgi:hypothetical protein